MRLLYLELAERPEHPFTLFNLGMTHVHGSRFGEGADYLRRSISRSNPNGSHLAKAYALLMYAEMRQSRLEQAHAACRQGRELFPRDVELRFREGVLMQELGRFAEARAAYLSVLSDPGDRRFASVDRGLTGFIARRNLAVLATSMGDLAEAERQWREVVREAPRYRQGWRGLGETLIQEQRLAEAEKIADELIKNVPVCAPRACCSKAVRPSRKTVLTRRGLPWKRHARNSRATWRRYAIEPNSYLNMARPTTPSWHSER